MVREKITWVNPDTGDTQVLYVDGKPAAMDFLYKLFTVFGRIPVKVKTVKIKRPCTFGQKGK